MRLFAGWITVVVLVALLAPVHAHAGRGPGGARILYASDWSGTSEIYAVDPSGRLPVAQLTFGRPPSCSDPVSTLACGFTDPVPSPDGRWLLYRDVDAAYYGQGRDSLWIAHADGSTPRLVAKDASSASWSPDSRLIAYGDMVVSVSGRRVAATEKRRQDRARRHGAVASLRPLLDYCGSGAPAWSPDGRSLAYPVCSWAAPSRRGRFNVVSVRGSGLAWSPDGRRIAYVDGYTVGLASASGKPLRVIGEGDDPAWSPDGRSLAFQSSDGLRILSLRTGKSRLLTTEGRAVGDANVPTLPLGLAWAPDGRSLAYIPGDHEPCCSAGSSVQSGDLRIVDLSGHTRIVVGADLSYGGRMVSFAWTRPPARLRYRRPLPAPATRVATDGILADGPVEFLAADGDRVAFGTACSTVSAWIPSAATSTLVAGNPPTESCGPELSREDVALAGGSVSWVDVCCNNFKVWQLNEQTFDTPPRMFELGRGQGGADIAGPAESGTHVDSPVGAGSLLVFSSWQSARDPASGHYVVIWQSIERAGPSGCPCPTLRTDQGPLLLDDVDAGRIAAHGNNAIVVLDSSGTELLSVPVKPAAVALSGNDLVVIGPGELRDYDATTAMLKHSWPLPGVASGPDCAHGINFGCPGGSRNGLPLRLQDAARGLVAYTLDDQIHLLRLSDGTDATVATGAHARFMNAGLVYSDGSRIHLAPYDQLPLH